MIKISFFVLLAGLVACSNLADKSKRLLVSKEFEDGSRMIVEMMQADSLSKLHVSVQLSGKRYSAISKPQQRIKMLYAMDSAFYLSMNDSKVYADAVQPVMTISSERYDYLVYYYGKNLNTEKKPKFCFKEPLHSLNEYAIELTTN